ncbi:DUF2098 domain-containing protein [Methanobacterium sp.]|uniref:DUF2098 domain-containing protein n=1 Tax=Methanobacterium sp. TaxID=2164 RepID=UPI003C740C4E
MEAVDICGQSLAKGSHVRYAGTGTVGNISDIKVIDEETWAKIDSTDLWYKSNTLQTVDKVEKMTKELSKEELRDKVKKMKKTIGDNIEMSTEMCDGGG